MSDFQIFSEPEIESLRQGGKILRGCLDLMNEIVEPGLTTKDLDDKAEEFIRSHDGAVPAFKGYNGFPGTLCTSINEDCVHGIPSDRVLQEGDIVSTDCGVLLDDLYTDACITIPVGEVSKDVTRLLDISLKALNRAVSMITAGIHTGDISHTIQSYLESEGFKPVQSLTGHGLGSTLHQFPDIPNIGTAGTGPILPKHTLIAIEPIVSAGADTVKQQSDGWTYTITDGGLSAHFEHTLLVTEEGVEIIA